MSISEVARLAGVTHGTVSRLINGRGGVAEDTAQRIRDAIDRLGYRPASRRRGRKPAPAGIRTGNVCLLLVGEPRGFLERPGVDATLAGIETLLKRHGMSLMLARVANLRDLPPAITGRKVDGVLLIGEASDTLPEPYRALPAVWVLSRRARMQRWADHVLPDNQEVGHLAAEYLAESGHHAVAFLNDQPRHPGFQERGESFRSDAAGRGLDVTMLVATSTEDEDTDDRWGLDRASRQGPLVDQLLNTSPGSTGLFVPTDEQTARLYPLLCERGLRPGQEIAIVSCDNQEFWLRQLAPRPPSIDLNFGLIGERAVEQLLVRISHPEHLPGTRILVPPLLAGPESSPR